MPTRKKEAPEPEAPETPASANGASHVPPPDAILPAPRYRHGKRLTLADDREWLVAPLTLDLIDEGGPATVMFGRLLAYMMRAAQNDNQIDAAVAVGGLTGALVAITHMSLDRNYPDLALTRRDVGSLIYIDIVPDLIEALFSLNDIKVKILELLTRLGLPPPSEIGTFGTRS